VAGGCCAAVPELVELLPPQPASATVTTASAASAGGTRWRALGTGGPYKPAVYPWWAVRRRLLPIFASFAGACLVGLLVYGVTAKSASRTLDDRIAHGEAPAAPELSRRLPLLGGSGSSSLAARKGQVVVLNFWASWCIPCQTEAPLLERAQAQLARHNSTVLGVTYLDAAPDSISFARQWHLTYPSLRDTGGSFARGYGTNQVPETFLIDRRGRVVAIQRGEIGQPFLDRAIALARAT
jgi:cytochrome c biogenesis protein CcmG, thiol:disulfide interchange protein DsbE